MLWEPACRRLGHTGPLVVTDPARQCCI